MNRILWAAALGCLGLAAHGQYVPDQMNYQAILTDYRGQAVTSVICQVKFRLYDEAQGGNLIWGETLAVTTTVRGLFSVVLGTGAGLGEPTEATNLRAAFASGTLVEQRYLELQPYTPEGTLQSPIAPRQRFLTAPYVFQANDAQEALGSFQVRGALYSRNAGTDVSRLIMTNAGSSITTFGDMVMDGSQKTGTAVNASFSSTTAVHSADVDALRVHGNLAVSQTMTVGGTALFYQAVSAADPVFQKGMRVQGVRALGKYQKIASSTNRLPSRVAPGDGFALIYYKTDGWDSCELSVSNRSIGFSLKHKVDCGACTTHTLQFYTTGLYPIAKGDTWSVQLQDGGSSHSLFDVYWIPYGY